MLGVMATLAVVLFLHAMVFIRKTVLTYTQQFVATFQTRSFANFLRSPTFAVAKPFKSRSWRALSLLTLWPATLPAATASICLPPRLVMRLRMRVH
jgi:hypothetical protein